MSSLMMPHDNRPAAAAAGVGGTDESMGWWSAVAMAGSWSDQLLQVPSRRLTAGEACLNCCFDGALRLPCAPAGGCGRAARASNTCCSTKISCCECAS